MPKRVAPVKRGRAKRTRSAPEDEDPGQGPAPAVPSDGEDEQGDASSAAGTTDADIADAMHEDAAAAAAADAMHSEAEATAPADDTQADAGATEAADNTQADAGATAAADAALSGASATPATSNTAPAHAGAEHDGMQVAAMQQHRVGSSDSHQSAPDHADTQQWGGTPAGPTAGDALAQLQTLLTSNPTLLAALTTMGPPPPPARARNATSPAVAKAPATPTPTPGATMAVSPVQPPAGASKAASPVQPPAAPRVQPPAAPPAAALAVPPGRIYTISADVRTRYGSCSNTGHALGHKTRTAREETHGLQGFHRPGSCHPGQGCDGRRHTTACVGYIDRRAGKRKRGLHDAPKGSIASQPAGWHARG